jgi:hypothetical protein
MDSFKLLASRRNVAPHPQRHIHTAATPLLPPAERALPRIITPAIVLPVKSFTLDTDYLLLAA